jgi:hypothetical protein
MAEIRTIMVLREMQKIAKQIAVLEKRRTGIRRTIVSLEGKYGAVTDKIIPLSDRAEKLSRVADIMQDDWRTWPWVTEVGLDKQFPRR